MRVIVKQPGLEPKIMEVDDICAINKLVGNVDDAGNGWDRVGSDVRTGIAPGIDEYVKDDAANNKTLEGNLWSSNDTILYRGTIVFAGYDRDNKTDFGACSLTDEQIEFCLDYIKRQDDNALIDLSDFDLDKEFGVDNSDQGESCSSMSEINTNTGPFIIHYSFKEKAVVDEHFEERANALARGVLPEIHLTADASDGNPIWDEIIAYYVRCLRKEPQTLGIRPQARSGFGESLKAFIENFINYIGLLASIPRDDALHLEFHVRDPEMSPYETIKGYYTFDVLYGGSFFKAYIPTSLVSDSKLEEFRVYGPDTIWGFLWSEDLFKYVTPAFLTFLYQEKLFDDPKRSNLGNYSVGLH